MRKACIAIALLLGGSSCGSCGPSERDLWVVNNSGVDFALFVDGKEALPTVASSTTENPRAVGHVKVKPGDHFLEARFVDGKKVVRGVMFSEKTSGYVFSPRRDLGICFYIVGDDGEKALDLKDEVIGLPHPLDAALENSPGAQDHTLRMRSCGR